MEKLLLEGCLEAMATGAVLGIQDMGAAGLTCSTCEMGARGGVGVEIELDRIPQRAEGMNSYEIMLSESQERMLLVASQGREQEVLDVFAKWGLDAVVAGSVIKEPRMRVRHGGVLVADIPNESLTDDAPLYHRPVGEWKAPVPLDPPEHILRALREPRDYTADLKKLLASANVCSKRWVYEQYDSMVQTNTVQGPGGEAGVMRIKGTQRGLSMALAGNGRWCYLDPKLGAMHAVAEAARKVACTGAVPVAATNCLNFGNPEKPEIMRQLSDAIDGIGEACRALGTPITGGNVSLYNETRGEGIYPTPVVGVVGILEDVSKAIPSGFQKPGDAVVLLVGLGPIKPEAISSDEDAAAYVANWSDTNWQRFGSSEYAKVVLGATWGVPPRDDLPEQASMNLFLARLAEESLLSSAQDVTSGGLAVALAKAVLVNEIGAAINVGVGPGMDAGMGLFVEDTGEVLVTCSKADIGRLKSLANPYRVWVNPIGETVNGHLQIGVSSVHAIEIEIAQLRSGWGNALEDRLSASPVIAEVMA